jgi:hypothetical protein
VGGLLSHSGFLSEQRRTGCNQDTIVSALVEQLIKTGPESMASVFTALFNLASGQAVRQPRRKSPNRNQLRRLPDAASDSAGPARRFDAPRTRARHQSNRALPGPVLAHAPVYPNLAVGVGDNKPALARLGGAVVRPLADKRGAAFLLPFRPMDRALPVKDAKAGFKIALVHRVKGGFLVGVLHAINRMKLGGSVFGFQDIEKAAALDAGELLIVARANDLCAAPGGVAEQSGKLSRRKLRELIDHNHGAPVPRIAAPIVEPHQFAGHGRRMVEAVRPHRLNNFVGVRLADDVIALGL